MRTLTRNFEKAVWLFALVILTEVSLVDLHTDIMSGAALAASDQQSDDFERLTVEPEVPCPDGMVVGLEVEAQSSDQERREANKWDNEWNGPEECSEKPEQVDD